MTSPYRVAEGIARDHMGRGPDSKAQAVGSGTGQLAGSSLALRDGKWEGLGSQQGFLERGGNKACSGPPCRIPTHPAGLSSKGPLLEVLLEPRAELAPRLPCTL